MTLQEADQQLLFQLYHLYDDREARNIADLVLEHLTGWKKIDRIINKTLPLSHEMSGRFAAIAQRLSSNEPVQYVIGEAWFGGLKFYVDPNVLIPRPETEELTEWVIQELGDNKISRPVIADLGTGSGCIAIVLQKKLPEALVFACDVSDGALKVASKNARLHNTDIQIMKMDLLIEDQFHLLPLSDILVSNPPYIPAGDAHGMSLHVKDFEPHLALFVPDKDPLLFYKQLAKLAQRRLKPGGRIYAEMHEHHADETVLVFEKAGLKQVEIKEDMQGKRRMIRGIR